ncbi:myc proto-oncogene protein isoform X2 [Leptopilina boulardi]|uniref:myc proto-oncogene protein isoform X2 n=1 Tax=Leptopilina boulardi TaxID=63433 RepID=UPI0021F509B9|nr:myc proto-oncogene protein isoform X2 [Leptopilina boulardi]
MQVVWSADGFSAFDLHLDSATTVVSDDVWKKFDLDLTQDYQKYSESPNPFDDFPFFGADCLSSSEIRHHDCMWAGLCISKEHNSTMATKKNPKMHKKAVPAGRSLLIPKNETSPHLHHQQQSQQQQQQQQSFCRTKSLESDGDSTRPETPQSTDSDAESDYEPPIFRHDQISINEKLSECFPDAVVKAAPVSVVTGQQVRTPRKPIKNENIIKEEPDIRHTLSDHCYHLNQPAVTQRLEHLGVQTPSESEEEIDVVSYEKPCRQTVVLPTMPSIEVESKFQTSVVKTVLKEKPTRPRGRPPLAANARKRGAPTSTPITPPAETKRSKRSSKTATTSPSLSSSSSSSSSLSLSQHQKRNKYSDIDDIPLAPTNGIKCIPPSRSSSDSEPDTEKRSLHNNMERQRRIDLRKAFEDLRLMVPGVERNEKAPKVSILRQAASYCDMLYKQDLEIHELRLEQERLLARVSQLRRECRVAR